jgi:alpha-mannosidase
MPSRWSAVSVDQPNIVVEAVKKAEDSDANVVRLYEAWGRRGRARVTFGIPTGTVSTADLLENELDLVAVAENAVDLEFRPFQIVTLLVRS